MDRLADGFQLPVAGYASPGEGFATGTVYRIPDAPAQVSFESSQWGIASFVGGRQKRGGTSDLSSSETTSDLSSSETTSNRIFGGFISR